jgi:hypothetical protein
MRQADRLYMSYPPNVRDRCAFSTLSTYSPYTREYSHISTLARIRDVSIVNEKLDSKTWSDDNLSKAGWRAANIHYCIWRFDCSHPVQCAARDFLGYASTKETPLELEQLVPSVVPYHVVQDHTSFWCTSREIITMEETRRSYKSLTCRLKLSACSSSQMAFLVKFLGGICHNAPGELLTTSIALIRLLDHERLGFRFLMYR